MDKQKVERISIRINGKERVFLSDEELNQEISAAKEVDAGLAEADIDHFETFVIGELVGHEPERERDNVIDFEERRNGKKNYSSKSFNRNNTLLLNKKKKRPLLTSGGGRKPDPILKKFIAVLISAIIIGVGFGYVVLSLFTDLSEGQGGGESHITVDNGQTVEENNEATGEVPSEVILGPIGANTGTTANGIAPLSVQIIQGGAFESVEAANQIANGLKENGKAAVVKPGSKPVLMFIGLGTDRNEAGIISQLYLNAGQDVYMKPFGLSEIKAGKVSNEKEAAFVSAGISLYQSLLGLSTETFDQKKINQATWKDIESKFTQWNQSKPQELPASLEQFANSISKTYQYLASYQIKADEQQLWNSQQALLDGLLSYKKWHDEKVAQ
ncbi:hypothetical protein P9E76_11165 [Schinkia azotoformans]|uniref:Stage II sporulation protein B n=1 Tax=Schinkia azotoformans LMG 9581 TaxID=1131731 RepID=K6C1D6_SCHAZ|nr:hypothetical protein [Schinkia azotoformans]EKN64970.1 stage II sporulation protein B [Schinkia azotoformans LMG 9581]MEC1640254.1 hypothetical protein [Schinkia azotoformans]MEC1720337.1 hypothetical protein [Schinkia azotoformans]MEC1945603.1 hypothetical protein [Schinkia azotoformans]MED4353775.1 hypothetical protein [Schinkia azotoformans]